MSQDGHQPQTGQVRIEPLEERHLLALRGFVNGLSDLDLTFVQEDLDEATLLSWVRSQARGKRWVAKSAETADAILGLVANRLRLTRGSAKRKKACAQ